VWQNAQGLLYYVQLAENAGFDVVVREEERQTFFLELREPQAL
jgi:uncharacterized protein YmfQ (DUF2313 family)